MRYSICATAVLLSLSLTGCGRNVVVPTPLAANQQTRALAVGDKMTYDVTISADIGHFAHEEKTCTDTLSIEAASNHGRTLPSAIIRTFHIKQVATLGLRGSSTVIEWYGQDVSGAIYLLGKSKKGLDWALVTDTSYPVDVPSKLADGIAWYYTVHFSNGEVYSQTCRIVGIERVITPAGEFDAYKVQVYATDAEGLVLTGYQWIRPEFSQGIKEDCTMTQGKEGHGLRMHLTTTLKSYHFAK